MNDIAFILTMADIARGFKVDKNQEFIVSPSGLNIHLTKIMEDWPPFEKDILPLLFYRTIESINIKLNGLTIIRTKSGHKVFNNNGEILFESKTKNIEKDMKASIRFCFILIRHKEKAKKNDD